MPFKSTIYSFFLLFFLSQNIVVFSQKKDSIIYSISAIYHQGIPLFDKIEKLYFLEDFAKGGEISIIRQRFHCDAWEKDFNDLEAGISLWFSTFGNSDVFGEGIILKTFANFRIFQLGKFNAKYQIAFGPAYVTKLYHVDKNFFNFNFSSHINAYSCIGLVANYRVSDRLSVTGNFLFHHISNGSFRKPNNGISILNTGIGVKYNLKPLPQNLPVYAGKTPSKSRELMGTFGMGVNRPFIANQEKFVSGSVSLTHLWFTNKTKAYGLGVDFIHLGGAQYVFSDFNKNIFVTNKFSDNLYIGFNCTMESHLGNTSPYFTIGYYVYHKTKPTIPIYSRLGLRQKITGNLSAHFSIKMGLLVSEFMEFGLAYRIRYKK